MLPAPGNQSRFRRVTAPVPVEPLADIQYEEEPPEVSRVVIRVEYKDESTREYEAQEPGDFLLSTGVTTRRTNLSIGSGASAAVVSHAAPTLRLSFTAHPRHNLHIRTHGPWQLLSLKAKAALSDFLSAMGYEAQ